MDETKKCDNPAACGDCSCPCCACDCPYCTLVCLTAQLTDKDVSPDKAAEIAASFVSSQCYRNTPCPANPAVGKKR